MNESRKLINESRHSYLSYFNTIVQLNIEKIADTNVYYTHG